MMFRDPPLRLMQDFLDGKADDGNDDLTEDAIDDGIEKIEERSEELTDDKDFIEEQVERFRNSWNEYKMIVM